MPALILITYFAACRRSGITIYEKYIIDRNHRQHRMSLPIRQYNHMAQRSFLYMSLILTIIYKIWFTKKFHHVTSMKHDDAVVGLPQHDLYGKHVSLSLIMPSWAERPPECILAISIWKYIAKAFCCEAICVNVCAPYGIRKRNTFRSKTTYQKCASIMSWQSIM